jgi:hypothetical protein
MEGAENRNHAQEQEGDGDLNVFIGWNVRMSDLIEETRRMGR